MAIERPEGGSVSGGKGGLPSIFLLGQNRVLGLLSEGAPIDRVLAEFCHVIEFTIQDTHCSVTLVDGERNVLHVAAAPSLPQAFRETIDGLAVGLAPGSSSSAAHRDQIVVSVDVAADPEWEGLREVAAENGLQACWSAPIRGVGLERDGASPSVVGTVDFYFDRPRKPTRGELMLLEMSASLASLVVTTARTQEEIGRQQLYDSVTDLPNRKVFQRELSQNIDQLSPRVDKLAVMLLDIDQFKEVNDTFGYAVGDFMLRSVAERLTDLRGVSDLIARFGDDEFAFLMGDVSSGEEIKERAKTILDRVTQPFDFGGQHLSVSATLGASLYPWDGEDGQTLLRNAENALFAAKKLGRNQFRLYAPTMGGYAFEKLQRKMALGYAVENRELEVFYQSKVRSSDGEVVGAEALVYWNHPAEGLLSPGKFIPIAEDSGLILQVGEWVLRSVCEQVKEWERQGLPKLQVAVNISGLQFRERSFVERVAAILERAALEPELIELEITETIAMTEVEKTFQRMRELARIGVRLAIDDFGTGYSSLSYLKRFPIDTLKIDKSFVLTLPQDKENRAIVKAVIALAHYLGLKVVAEGVEKAKQAAFLTEQGCDFLQGYHFGRPVKAPEFARTLAERQPAAS